MRPALESFGAGSALRLVLVYSGDEGAERLCGLFPFEIRRRYRGMPLRHLALWRHRHCFVGTPLVRRGRERQTLDAVLDWIAGGASGAIVVQWDLLASDGPFHRALRAALEDASRASFVREASERALLRPMGDAAVYLAQALRGKTLKELRRCERRLAERGRLEYRELERAEDAREWLESFLSLEASGWKGANGSALACSGAGRAFFVDAALEAARRGRLMMLGLFLDDRPVALKCNFLAPGCAYAFKIAYDERYARYSPGLLLELENVRRFHARPDLVWMDSCAEPVHFMINRLWLDRRRFVTLVTAAGRLPGQLFVRCMPALRWCWRSLPEGVRRAAPA
jgi:CelD/BcsL family acetyltransferase involved in cellulose biosynthesis